MDVLICLQELASLHRSKLACNLIAITGSNGKTTSKELISSVLRKKYNVLSTEGNLNNHIGVPLTLLKLNKSHQFAVIEMGANHLKEIELLCEIAKPNLQLWYLIVFNILNTPPKENPSHSELDR